MGQHCVGLLRTEPKTLTLMGFEPARKGWHGGPVSTAAPQSDQHPSFTVHESNKVAVPLANFVWFGIPKRSI